MPSKRSRGIRGARSARSTIHGCAFARAGPLGFTLEDRWGPPFADMKLGDLTLWVSGPGTSASKPLADGSTPRPGGWNRIVIEVADIDAAVEQLAAKGGRFRSEPIRGPGGRQVLCDDPSGNPIELFEARK